MTTIEYTLEEKDIRENADKILEAMNGIRQECLSDHQVQPKNRTEYVALARRLASCIKADGKKFYEQGKTIEGVLAEQGALWNYDPLQAGYWIENEPKARDFTGGLAKLALSFFENRTFFDIFAREGEYHCFQALKLIDNREASPVSELPLEIIVGETMEGSTTEKLKKFSQMGLLKTRIKTSNAGNLASQCKKDGYTAKPEERAVVVFFDAPKDRNSFYNLAFGYEEITNMKDLLCAKTQEGYALLDARGNEIDILGEKRFIEVSEDDGIMLRSPKGVAYLRNGKPLYKRWFQRELDKQTQKDINQIGKKFGDESAEWLLASQISLENLLKLDEKKVKLLCSVGCSPASYLFSRFDEISSALPSPDKRKDFVMAYDQVRFSERDNSSMWQMIDSEVDLKPESVDKYLEVMLGCFNDCPALTPALRTYQTERSEHATKASLLHSTVDFLLTYRAMQKTK